MAKEVFKRSEKKFTMDAQTFHGLLEQLAPRMEPDEYSKLSGRYTICNLYYDTPDHYYIRQSLAGPYYKEKLRMRSYGTPNPSGQVFLEIKKKMGGIVYKRRSGLPLMDAYRFLEGEDVYRPEANLQVLREIEYMTRTRPVRPMVYIAYDRLALFQKEDSGLRITFDTNIRSRRTDLRLESGDYGTPLLRDGVWLMEVKSEKGIPVWLTSLLMEHEIYPTGFSKYGAEYQRFRETQLVKGGKTPCLKPSLAALLTPSLPSAGQSLAS